MNLEQTVTALSTQNEQFKLENDQLKAVLGIVQENRDLRATVQGFIGADDSPGSALFSPLGGSKTAIFHELKCSGFEALYLITIKLRQFCQS